MQHSSIALAPLNLLILLLPTALLLIFAGRKRRIGDEPHCRKCNYLLHGLTSQRCPECGSVLTSAAIVIGEPRRRWKSFIAGWTMLLLIAAFAFSGGFEWIRTVDWYQYKPTYFVLRDLNSGNSADVPRAWRELIRRDGSHSLDATTRDRLVQFAVANQASAKAPYGGVDTDTVNYLGDRVLAGDLPKDQQARFFNQIVRLQLRVRPRVIAGDFVPYLVIHDDVGPSGVTFYTGISMTSLAIDGKLQPNALSGGGSSSSGFAGGSEGSSVPSPPVGSHILTIGVRIETHSGSNGSPSAGTLFSQIDRTVTAPFEVLAKEPVGYEQPIVDPKLAAALRAAIVPQHFHCNPNDPGKTLGCDFLLKALPVNIAFDVIIRYGAVEKKVGPFDCAAQSSGDYFYNYDLKTAVPASVDVILRPDEKAARDSVDLNSFWDQEIVYTKIPVTPN